MPRRPTNQDHGTPRHPTADAGSRASRRLRDGDIIVALDARTVTSLDDLHKLLTEDRIGATVTLSVLRGVERTDLRITIANRS